MNPRHLVCLSLAVLASTELYAQTSVVLPDGAATTEGSSNNTYPWGRNASAIRFQNIYDSSHFTVQGLSYPILISGARWRANASTGTWSGTTYNNVEVYLSTAAVDYASASPTFANNRGVDHTLVHSGAVNFIGGTGNGLGVPGPNVIDLTFAAPFLYDPSSGNDFLCEVTFPAGSWSGGGTTACDAFTTGSMATRIYNISGPTALTGTVGQNHALALELVYVPASGLYPNFSATPQSGSAPLNVQFSDTSFTSDPLGVQQWSWDLNGDNIADSSLQNPTFLYGAEGYYNVSLTVTDTIHPSATEIKTAFIAVDAVSASFSTTAVSATRVRFNDTSAGSPTSWAWDFNNDSIIDSTLQNPVYTFPAPGSYNVNLSVADAFSTDSVLVSVGVSVLPLPGFGNTYSSSTSTRGFYFQAPTRFSIISTNVPDESNHGLQNVAIYRMASAPPAYSGSASGGLEFFSAGQPSGIPIPCAVSFEAGEWVGIIGACGDSTTMRSSYATPVGPFASSIFGNPTTLIRFITQTNLVTTGGNAPYSSEAAAALARIELGLSNAVGISYGAGTPSGGVLVAPRLFTTGLPRMGTTAELTVTQSDPTAFGYLLLSLGRGNLPLPFGTLLVDIFTYQMALPMNNGIQMNVGDTSYQIAVPNDPVLNGAGPVTWQNLNLVPGSPNQVSLSNGHEWFSGL